MKNIIFLDLDGVLNITSGANRTFEHRYEIFEIDLVSNLNKLLNKDKDIFIVFTQNKPDLDYHLSLAEFSFFDRVLDILPDNLNTKGENIFKWIKKNSFEGRFLCIDDNLDQLIKYGKKRLKKEDCIEIDPSIGLSSKNIKEIISFFN